MHSNKLGNNTLLRRHCPRHINVAQIQIRHFELSLNNLNTFVMLHIHCPSFWVIWCMKLYGNVVTFYLTTKSTKMNLKFYVGWVKFIQSMSHNMSINTFDT